MSGPSTSTPSATADAAAPDLEAPLSTYLTLPSKQQSQQSNASSSSSASPSANTSQAGIRIYIGNLHPSVDEYVLIQTFSRYGKIAKLDFLFHKAGPMKGKPRGYAFLEYTKNDEALQAVMEANNRTLRGRPISVSFANQTQYADAGSSSGGVGPHRKRDSEAPKTTTLSMIKNASVPEGTNAKISAMEAKLAKLREARTKKAATPTSASSSRAPDGKGLASLPAKPPAPSSSSTNGGARR